MVQPGIVEMDAGQVALLEADVAERGAAEVAAGKAAVGEDALLQTQAVEILPAGVAAGKAAAGNVAAALNGAAERFAQRLRGESCGLHGVASCRFDDIIAQIAGCVQWDTGLGTEPTV